MQIMPAGVVVFFVYTGTQWGCEHLQVPNEFISKPCIVVKNRGNFQIFARHNWWMFFVFTAIMPFYVVNIFNSQ